MFVICTALLIISINVSFMVNARYFYEYGFEKYRVTDVTGIEEEELSNAAQELIDYFSNNRSSPQIQVVKNGQEIDLFTERELIHLEDVKALIQFFYLLLWITLGYAGLYIIAGFLTKKRAFLRQLMQGLLGGAILTLIIIAVVGIWAIIDFDSLFLRFHLASFTNDLWQLDPSRHYLIMMFPEEFFSDAAMLLTADIAVMSVILGVPAWFYLRRTRLPQLHEEQLPDEQPAQGLPPPIGTDTPPAPLEKEANDETTRSDS